MNTHSRRRKEVIVVRTLLLCKNTNCATCSCTQFSQNGCQSDCKHDYGFVYALNPKKRNNMLTIILFYNVLVLNMFLNMSHCALWLQILLWLPGKGGSESKTRRPEFIYSQVGNPISKLWLWVCPCWHTVPDHWGQRHLAGFEMSETEAQSGTMHVT
jgi:hypothetical protein